MIVNKIKRFVDGMGITRYQFYKRSGISKSTAYALYEDEGRIPDAHTLDCICTEFSCKPGDLLDHVLRNQ